MKAWFLCKWHEFNLKIVSCRSYTAGTPKLWWHKEHVKMQTSWSEPGDLGQDGARLLGDQAGRWRSTGPLVSVTIGRPLPNPNAKGIRPCHSLGSDCGASTAASASNSGGAVWVPCFCPFPSESTPVANSTPCNGNSTQTNFRQKCL